MNTVKAVYNGESFVPIGGVCNIKKGAVVRLSIVDEKPQTNSDEILAAFHRITEEFRGLNKTEPLGDNFDEILLL